MYTYRVNCEPRRIAGNHTRVRQSQHDTDLRVEYDDTQTATERRVSCMRKYTDSDATTWRYDTVTIRTRKITHPRLTRRPRCQRQERQTIFTRYAHIYNVHETKRNFKTKRKHRDRTFFEEVLPKKYHNAVQRSVLDNLSYHVTSRSSYAVRQLRMSSRCRGRKNNVPPCRHHISYHQRRFVTSYLNKSSVILLEQIVILKFV